MAIPDVEYKKTKFTDRLLVEKVVDKVNKKFLWLIPYKGVEQYWVTQRSFRYYVGKIGSSDFVDVPKGFETDFASIPIGLRNILPKDGPYTQAAVLHDWLYNQRKVHGRSRAQCDLVLYEAMGAIGVPQWQRTLIYNGVKLGGWVYWNK